jgi:hypothetical protein
VVILYHASNQTVEEPVIVNRFSTLDFGTGFYTTPSLAQAEDFAKKVFLRRKGIGAPVVTSYLYDTQRGESELSIIEFAAPDEAWLEFVVSNRRNSYVGTPYDLAIGPVANDDVFATITLFETGQLSKEEAINRFRVKKLYTQYLFHTEKALELLKFKSSGVLENDNE